MNTTRENPVHLSSTKPTDEIDSTLAPVQSSQKPFSGLKPVIMEHNGLNPVIIEQNGLNPVIMEHNGLNPVIM